MRTSALFVIALLCLGVIAVPSTAAPSGWHTSLKDGVAAAEKSGKPLLVMTAWSRKL